MCTPRWRDCCNLVQCPLFYFKLVKLQQYPNVPLPLAHIYSSAFQLHLSARVRHGSLVKWWKWFVGSPGSSSDYCLCFRIATFKCSIFYITCYLPLSYHHRCIGHRYLGIIQCDQQMILLGNFLLVLYSIEMSLSLFLLPPTSSLP